MGTRNLTVVFMDGDYRVAQYGQWDGYPEGQGLTCLRFLRDEMDEKKFREALKATKIISNEYDFIKDKSIIIPYDSQIVKRINRAIESGVIFPEFHRDTGAKILGAIQRGETISRYLENKIVFAADSGCEWAWVVDLDKRKFEAYVGYNKTPLTNNDRFYFLQCFEEDLPYHGVKMVTSWNLDDLPTDSKFLETIDALIKERITEDSK